MSSNKCEVVGVEISPKAGKNAQKYCKEVFIGDVESIELSSNISIILITLSLQTF